MIQEIIHKKIKRDFPKLLHLTEHVQITSFVRYLCNENTKVNFTKMSYHWKNVTCKNCLKGRE